MMSDFKELLMKKAKAQKQNPPDEKKLAAKAAVMKELSDDLGKSIGGDIKGMKKVTVAAKDSAGLKEGLEKAEEMLPDGEDEMEEACEPGEEMAEGDLSSKIAELEKQLLMLKAKVK